MTDSPEELAAKLHELRARQTTARSKKPPSGSGMAMRIAIELIASIAVSSAIGYYLDEWLATTPLLLIICMLFGTAAGLVTIKRVNEAFGKQLEAEEAQAKQQSADNITGQ